LEIFFQSELISQSIGFIWIGSYLSRFVIKDEEKTCINIILVKFNALQLIPKISLVANQIPSQLFLVETEILKMLIISSLNSFKLLFRGHFLLFREWQYVCNLSLIVVKSSIKLPTGVSVLEFLCVSQNLYMYYRTDVNLF